MTDQLASERGRTSAQVGRSFEERVADLYHLLNYRVEFGRLFSGRQVDLFLHGVFGDLEIFRAIECKSGVVNADDIDSFVAKLALVRREYPSALGTLVAASGFTDSVASHGAAAGLSLVPFRVLEASLFDAHSYAMRLDRDLSSDDRYDAKLYVEPLVGWGQTGEDRGAFAVLEEWLDDGSWTQLTLLGDVGTGKSFFSRMVARKALEAYRRDPLEARLPVLIDLRNTDRLLSLEGLVITHFTNYGLGHVSFDVFKHMVESGRLVLILDGFDEMAARVGPGVTARNFQELTKCVRGRAKVLLTCRTHYFRSRTEEEEVILGQKGEYESETAKDLYWELISRKGFAIAYMRPFRWPQVEEYVRKVNKPKASATLEKIRATYNLVELSQRPLLLEMIVKSLDRLEGAEVNISTLYQVFTDAWVHRDSWRETLTPNAKRDFVTALAIGLWRSGLERLHYTELESYVRSHLAPHIHTPQQFAEIDNEVRTATFVTRDDAGNYGFAHKSYGEFFLSRHLATELLQGRTECLAGPRLSQEIAEFIRWLVNTDTERLLEQVLVGPYSVNVSENALHTLYYCRRSAALADARGGGAERAALRIPLPNSIQLNGARLEGAVLEGASLVGANCENAFLQGAVLSGVDLSRGHLRGANLSTTELSRARVDAADISGANCSGIQLGGASAVEADFTSADLTDSFLQGLIWTGAQFLSALVGGASADPDLEAEFERLGLIRRDFPLERGPESPDFWTAISELHPRIRRAARARAPFKGIDAEDLASQVILQMAAPAVQRRFVAVSSTERWAMIATALSRLSSTVFQEEEGRRRRVGAIEVDGINYVGEEVFDVETDDASGEERVLLREFRETLSPEAWRLLSGRYFEGYTINELAALYELTPKYVSRQLKKCGDLLLNWLAAPPPKPGS